MGIPNEHKLKFNSLKDAKSLLRAVEKRFEGNAATKKTQRNLLKQQYENFTASSSEVLDQTFDRLQKIISQLEIHGESISQEDVNKKFLRSLECKALRNQENKNRESTRKTVPVETHASLALASCDGLGGLEYNVVPPPYTGNFLPLKPNLSGLEEFVNEFIVSDPTVKKPMVNTSEAKDSADKLKVDRNNFSSLIIEDWISDSEDEDESKPKIEKTTVKSSFAKIEFVKSKEQVKSPRKTIVIHVVNAVLGNRVNAVKASTYWVWKPKTKVIDHVSKHNSASITLKKFDYEKGVIDSGCSRHMTGNMSYLINYDEIDGGYVAFG
nr:hypothetical protein [Tanacetum cinerariifolium]